MAAAFVGGAVGGGAFVGRRGALVCRQSRPRARSARVVMKTYDVEVLLDGETHTVPVDEDVTLLEAIEEFGLEVDSSCRAGVCMTCAAKVVKGKVDLGEAALAEEAKEQGFVLTCSAFPRSENLKIEMNKFDDAYDMQYGQYEAEEKAKSGGLLGSLFGK